jgi:hypothetical protein
VSTDSAVIGPYKTGEKPLPLTYTFQDNGGVAINLTGFTAKVNVREKYGAATQYNATVSTPLSGIVTYAWTGAEFPTPGQYQAEFWVGNGVARYDSILLKFDVRAAVGPVPAI